MTHSSVIGKMSKRPFLNACSEELALVPGKHFEEKTAHTLVLGLLSAVRESNGSVEVSSILGWLHTVGQNGAANVHRSLARLVCRRHATILVHLARGCLLAIALLQALSGKRNAVTSCVTQAGSASESSCA